MQRPTSCSFDDIRCWPKWRPHSRRRGSDDFLPVLKSPFIPDAVAFASVASSFFSHHSNSPSLSLARSLAQRLFKARAVFPRSVFCMASALIACLCVGGWVKLRRSSAGVDVFHCSIPPHRCNPNPSKVGALVDLYCLPECIAHGVVGYAIFMGDRMICATF